METAKRKIHIHLTLRTRYAHGQDTHTWEWAFTLLEFLRGYMDEPFYLKLITN